jgi:O-antigen/teichoic acid export membrane protein
LRGKLLAIIKSNSAIVTASAWISRLIIAAAQIISIPVLSEYLGLEVYALIAVVFSTQGWWLLADMGLGSSLQNLISEQRANNRNYRDYIFSAALLSLGFAFTILTVVWICRVSITRLILPEGELAEFLGIQLVMTSAILYLLIGMGSIAYKILYAEKKGYWANILPAMASIFSLCLLVLCSNLKPTDINIKAELALIAWNLPFALLSFGALLVCAIKNINGKISKKIIFHLIKNSWKFSVFGIFSAITLQLDIVIIGKYLNSKDVVLYNIVTKIFSFLSFFYIAILQAFWPLCTEAFFQKKWSHIRRITKISLINGVLIISLGGVFILVYKNELINTLLPSQEIELNIFTWSLMMMYMFTRVWSDTYAMLLQSISRLEIFMYYIPIQACLSVITQIYLINIYGINGIIMGLIISFLLTSVWILPKEFNKIYA